MTEDVTYKFLMTTKEVNPGTKEKERSNQILMTIGILKEISQSIKAIGSMMKDQNLLLKVKWKASPQSTDTALGAIVTNTKAVAGQKETRDFNLITLQTCQGGQRGWRMDRVPMDCILA